MNPDAITDRPRLRGRPSWMFSSENHRPGMGFCHDRELAYVTTGADDILTFEQHENQRRQFQSATYVCMYAPHSMYVDIMAAACSGDGYGVYGTDRYEDPPSA